MRFAPTEEQLEFTAAVRGVLADTCTPAELRTAWGGSVGAHTGSGSGRGCAMAAWDALTEMGVLGLTLPESTGGLAMSDDDLVGIVIECGYAGLPDPLSDTAGVAAGALAGLSGGGDVVSEWMVRIAEGSRIAVGFGQRPLVPSAENADGLLLFGADPVSGDGAASVQLVERDEVDLEAVESVDGSRFVRRVDCAADRGLLPLDGEEALVLAGSAFDRAAVLDAAMLVGLSRRMLDITIEYVSERRQFGAPVGSFQAVKHHLADAALATEFAEPLVRRGAHLLGHADGIEEAVSVSVAASMAKQRAALAALAVTEATLQCHGAIGYTVEADLHLFMKRAWAIARQRGDADWHRGRVLGAVLG